MLEVLVYFSAGCLYLPVVSSGYSFVILLLVFALVFIY